MTIVSLKNGRATDVGRYLEAMSGFRAGPVAVDAFRLYRSHLGNDGARYEALADYLLGD